MAITNIPFRTDIEPGSDIVVSGSEWVDLSSIIQTKSGALQLSDIQFTSASEHVFHFLTDVSDPDFQTEQTAKKKVGGFQNGKKKSFAETIALLIPVSNETLEDSAFDLISLLTPSVISKFANKIDSAIVGKLRGATLLNPKFGDNLTTTITQSININEYEGARKLEQAVIDAAALIDENGFYPNAVLLSSSAKYQLAKETKATETSDWVYDNLDDFFGRYDLDTAYTNNLNKLNDADADDNVVAVVGQWDLSKVRFRSAISFKYWDAASYEHDGVTHHGAQTNETTFRFEQRAMYAIVDPSAFVQVIKAEVEEGEPEEPEDPEQT